VGLELWASDFLASAITTGPLKLYIILIKKLV
jgi:hypothetical protein